MDALIFIDTNIFLDFYRIRTSEISLKYLDLIEKNQSKIVTTTQVEMEFKKNRQKVILESLNKIKPPNWETLTPPAILSDTKPSELIEKKKKEITNQQKKLKERIVNILRNPASFDPVYQTLQRLFKTNSAINLDRFKTERISIRNLAKKRFILGYPPRKKEDNSIGDAINWEWIVKCSKDKKKDIIIVTRDSDYGIIHDKDEKEGILNDWLLQEFKERISQKRKIILTDRLAWAFDQIQINVSQELLEEEDKILEQQLEDKLQVQKEFDLDEFMKKLRLNEFQKELDQILLNRTVNKQNKD